MFKMSSWTEQYLVPLTLANSRMNLFAKIVRIALGQKEIYQDKFVFLFHLQQLYLL